MSTRAFLTAAAAGMLLMGAGFANAGDKGHLKTALDAAADTPDYYAIAPTAAAFTGPDYYATVQTPTEFYASLDLPSVSTTQFASIDDILASEGVAFTAPFADASATLEYPQALEAAASDASFTIMPSVEVVSSMPVADTPQNRARFGQPMSRAGKMTAPVGN